MATMHSGSIAHDAMHRRTMQRSDRLDAPRWSDLIEKGIMRPESGRLRASARYACPAILHILQTPMRPSIPFSVLAAAVLLGSCGGRSDDPARDIPAQRSAPHDTAALPGTNA